MKRFFTVAALAFTAAALSAEAAATVNLIGGIGFPEGDDPTGLYAGMVTLDFPSPRSHKNVKGLVSLDIQTANLYPLDALSLDRAWIKVRLPWFRITAGKTRVAWGEGTLFNAGDLLFGSTDLSVDLTGDDLRTAGKWLGSVYFPLPFVDSFTFLEAVVIPPGLTQTDLTVIEGGLLYDALAGFGLLPPAPVPTTFPQSLPATEGGAGFRYSSEPFGIKTETGYFFDGATMIHRAYFSFQGALYVDLYGSVSTGAEHAHVIDLENRNADFLDGLYGRLLISAGILNQFEPAYGHTVSTRLEAILYPDGEWAEDPAASAYGIYLYPELAWTPPGSWNAFLRSIVSPIDQSAQITGGLSWKVTQGLDFFLFVSGNVGETDDTFAWGSTAAGATNVATTFGMEYNF